MSDHLKSVSRSGTRLHFALTQWPKYSLMPIHLCLPALFVGPRFLRYWAVDTDNPHILSRVPEFGVRNPLRFTICRRLGDSFQLNCRAVQEF